MQQFSASVQAGDYEKAYRAASKSVMGTLKGNSQTLCVVAADPDSLAIVLLAEYLMSKNKDLTAQ